MIAVRLTYAFFIYTAHEETWRLLLVPNKPFYLLNISQHMEQVLPEACLGEVQVIVRPYVQFIYGSDLPRNIPRSHHRCQACVNKIKDKRPNLCPISRGKSLISWASHTSVACSPFWNCKAPICCNSTYL